MANNLRNLIREAFNTAYNKHKFKILSESVETLKNKMSAGDINKANLAFNEISANPEIAYKYAWSPQTLNGDNPKNPQAPFNLLMELIAENLDPETKKKVFMAIYNDRNPALINIITNRLMGMKGSHVTPEEASMAVETAWNEMFLGDKHKTGDLTKKSFTDALAEYKPLDGSNFGAYLMQRLISSSSNALRDYFNTVKPKSLDAPSNITGKSTDIGDGEVEDEIPMGKGATDDDYNEDETNLYQPEAGSEFDLASDEAIAARNNARQMIKRMEKSLYEAIAEFRNYEEPTPNQEKGFTALEEILGGLTIKAVSAKLGFNATSAIQDLKKNKNFVRIVDDYLLRNGFVNSRGRVDSFINIMPQYIEDSIQFKKTGKLPTDFQDDRRAKAYATGSEAEEDNGLNFKQMHQLVINTKKAVKELRKKGIDSKALPALDALLTGVDPETVAKNFGYENPEGLAQDIAALNITARPEDIADSAKSIRYGSPTKAVPVYVEPEELAEGRTFWFLERIMYEEFMYKNIDIITENVYKRISKINS